MIYSVQMLRFVAALLVVLFHSVSSLDARLGAEWSNFRYLAGFGASGVHIFFVISGFIMVYTSHAKFGDWQFPSRFFRRRFVRIYPVYWILALVNVPVSLLIGLPIPQTIREFAGSMILWPGLSSDLIYVGWTLSYEMFFYVVFAGLVLLPMTRAVVALSLLFLGLVVFGRVTGFGTAGLGYLATSPLLLEFVLGAWIGWCAVRVPTLPNWMSIGVVLIGFAGFTLGLVWGYSRAPTVILWGLPSAAIVFGFVYLDGVSWLKGVFRRFALLGEASYALYLIHAILIPTAASLFMSDVELTRGVLMLWVISMTTISIVVSVLFCLYVERPVTRALNRTLRSRNKQTPAQSAQP